MKNYTFEVDKGTMIVLNMICRFLKKYFNYHSDDDAIAAINNYYSKRMPDRPDEKDKALHEEERASMVRDFVDLHFWHDHPFLVAGRIRYMEDTHLQQQYGSYHEWLRAIDWWNNIPEEAREEYIRCMREVREASGKS